MTEKRYKRLVSSIDYYYCIDTTNDDKGLTEDDMLNLLNEQDKEIQKLKHRINGLKSELSIWKEDANEHIRETNKLFEENKQLKQQNEQAIDLILNGIMEMHDGKRDYAEKLLNEAIELIK